MQVSKILRQKAINEGKEIDSIFRNENGISMQLAKIVSLLYGKESGLAKTKLFNEIANLYHDDFSSYFQILIEAKNTVDISNYCKNTFLENIDNLEPTTKHNDEVSKLSITENKLIFHIEKTILNNKGVSTISNQKNWKSEYLQFIIEKSPHISSDIYLAMSKVEQYTIESGLFPCSFYEMLSPDTVKILKEKVINNTNFINKNRTIMRFIKDGISLLSDFVNVNNCSSFMTPSKTNELISNPFNDDTSFCLSILDTIEPELFIVT